MVTLTVFSLFSFGVIEEVPEPKQAIPLIYDTDMGNDVDDGYALGVIHALQSRGECKLLAVTVTKDHELAGPFVDVLNTFYSRGDVPVGVVRNGAEPKQGKFLGLAAEKKDDAYRFPQGLGVSGGPLRRHRAGGILHQFGSSTRYGARRTFPVERARPRGAEGESVIGHGGGL